MFQRCLANQVVILILFAALSGCGEFRKLDDMREATQEMNKTTKELLEKTKELHEETKELHTETQKVTAQAEHLGKTTDELLAVTRDDLTKQMDSLDNGFGELYDSLRQGDSANLRRMSFEKMLESKTLQNRLAEAGLFVMAFEYQLFSGVGQDVTRARKQLLYQQAMMELFLRIDELAPRGEKISPLASPQPNRVTSRENRASAFNCLAAVLHKTNRKQQLDSSSREQVSLYDLLITAMKMKPRIDSGSVRLPTGPHFAKEVLSRQARVKQLLQARHNMFVQLFLGASTDLAQKGPLGRSIGIARGIEVDLNSPEMGAAHLDFLIEEILKPAVETRTDMIALGIQPQLTRSMRLIAKRIRFRENDRAPALISGRQKTVQELWNTYIGDESETSDSDEISDETSDETAGKF